MIEKSKFYNFIFRASKFLGDFLLKYLNHLKPWSSKGFLSINIKNVQFEALTFIENVLKKIHKLKFGKFIIRASTLHHIETMEIKDLNKY